MCVREQVVSALTRRDLISRAGPGFIEAVVDRLHQADPLPRDVIETVILQTAHDRGRDFHPTFRDLLPQSLASSPLVAECGFDLALPFYRTPPPLYEFESTVNAVFVGRFRTRVLGPMCHDFLARRRTFGVGTDELRDYAFGHLGVLRPHQFFDPGRGGRFRTWLDHLVIRPAFTQLRREIGVRAVRRGCGGDPRPKTEYVVPSPLPAEVPGRAEPLAGRELAEWLTAAVEALSAEDREILLLRAVEEMGYAELAARLSISEKAAYKRYSRALGRLRERLEQEVKR